MQCKTASEISLGDVAEVEYRIEEEDLVAFGKISGDLNPIHFDEAYASESPFRARIAHGLISVSKFSGLFGTKLPGLGAIWDDLTIKFLSPAFLNRTYKAKVRVEEKHKKLIKFRVWVEDADGNVILDGTSSVRPASPATKTRITRSTN